MEIKIDNNDFIEDVFIYDLEELEKINVYFDENIVSLAKLIIFYRKNILENNKCAAYDVN